MFDDMHDDRPCDWSQVLSQASMLIAKHLAIDYEPSGERRETLIKALELLAPKAFKDESPEALSEFIQKGWYQHQAERRRVRFYSPSPADPVGDRHRRLRTAEIRKRSSKDVEVPE